MNKAAKDEVVKYSKMGIRTGQINQDSQIRFLKNVLEVEVCTILVSNIIKSGTTEKVLSLSK